MSDIRRVPKGWVHPIHDCRGTLNWVPLKPYEQYKRDFRSWCDNLEKFFIKYRTASYQDFTEVYGDKPEHCLYMPKFRERGDCISVHYYGDKPAIPVSIYTILNGGRINPHITIV